MTTLRNAFVLKRIGKDEWDSMNAIVVIADSERDARLVAATHAGGNSEGQEWRDETQTSCDAFATTQRECGIVLDSWLWS